MQRVRLPPGMPESRITVPASSSSYPASNLALLEHILVESRGWPKCSGPAPMWRPRWSAWLPASAWPSAGCCRHVGSEPADGSSLSRTLPFKHTNKPFFQKLLNTSHRCHALDINLSYYIWCGCSMYVCGCACVCTARGSPTPGGSRAPVAKV